MIKIILKQDVERIGKMGKVVSVKDGFARNYLFPKNLAVIATESSIAHLEKEQKKKENKQEIVKKQSQELAEKLVNYSCTITAEAHDESLYGSVGVAEITAALADENITISQESILLEHPIKKLGIYEIALKLHPEVTGKIKVWVVKK